MKKAVLTIFVLSLLISPVAVHLQAQDADIKIAILNMRRVLAESDLGKQAETKVREYYDAKRNELQQEMASLREDLQALESQRSVLSEEAFLERQNELQKRELDLQQKSKAAEREFQTMQREEIQAFMEIAGPIIESIGVEEGYTLILDNPPTATNQIIYFNKANDITDMVIERINAQSGQ